MTELLKKLQDAIDGEQPPDKWKALLRVAHSTIQYHEEESRVYQQLLEQASDKLSALSQPAFHIGDAVTAWTHTGGSQSNAKDGAGSGGYVTGKVENVDFRYGRYVYTVDGTGNIFEDLIRKVG